MIYSFVDSDSGVLLAEGGIYSYDSTEMIRALNEAKQMQKKAGKIVMMLKSNGGSVTDGIAIGQLVNWLGQDVAVVGFGFVASAATYLASLADRFYMYEGTQMLIHPVTRPTNYYGETAQESIKGAEEVKQVEATVAEVYSRKIERNKLLVNGSLEDTQKMFVEMMQKDTYLSAQQALDMGLIDGIIPINGKKIVKRASDTSSTSSDPVLPLDTVTNAYKNYREPDALKNEYAAFLNEAKQSSKGAPADADNSDPKDAEKGFVKKLVERVYNFLYPQTELPAADKKAEPEQKQLSNQTNSEEMDTKLLEQKMQALEVLEAKLQSTLKNLENQSQQNPANPAAESNAAPTNAAPTAQELKIKELEDALAKAKEEKQQALVENAAKAGQLVPGAQSPATADNTLELKKLAPALAKNAFQNWLKNSNSDRNF